ncbi:uncharacterized protein BX664DRAFT_388803 [Halteromyces radiatus]|uniref:uncharacterized protein n=1 Tax=Halteromyces radiatus TaxID=101107 RepID=UPI002220D498|nr:uncharacterized protein BX664DRAFT_388803 [Halteromyces radiatus]KAI8079823.1 hypothetical protein BX664DRAFT_388803 [Halteromyces radiatus]
MTDAHGTQVDQKEYDDTYVSRMDILHVTSVQLYSTACIIGLITAAMILINNLGGRYGCQVLDKCKKGSSIDIKKGISGTLGRNFRSVYGIAMLDVAYITVAPNTAYIFNYGTSQWSNLPGDTQNTNVRYSNTATLGNDNRIYMIGGFEDQPGSIYSVPRVNILQVRWYDTVNKNWGTDVATIANGNPATVSQRAYHTTTQNKQIMNHDAECNHARVSDKMNGLLYFLGFHVFRNLPYENKDVKQ